MNWKQDEWTGCYPSQWKGLIVPEAMAHPAKFSSKLIRRIYAHMQAEGWLKAGDTVIDPFGGIALGALDAMRLGLKWSGVELEAKFVDLGGKNIGLWNKKFSRMPRWSGDAVLLQGDSRKLLEVLGTAISGQQSAVSSPPYAEARVGQESGQEHCGRGDQYGDSEGQLGAMKGDGFEGAISSPPFEQKLADGGWQMLGKYAEEGKLTVKQVKGNGSKSYPSWDKERDTSYGETPGQLGGMDGGNFEAAVSSPPYVSGGHHPDQTGAYNTNGRGQGQTSETSGYGETEGQLGKMGNNGFEAAISSPPFRHSEGGTPEPKPGGSIDEKLYARHAAGNSAAEGYGASEGQLANMGEGDWNEAISGQRSAEAAISSPPYEGTRLAETGNPMDSMRRSSETKYSDIYEDTMADDFWMAARVIVEQVYLALAPGTHACWVVKGFVKNKAYVDFPDQWRQLCEAVGFVTLHEHRAMLNKKLGSQHTTDGDIIHQEKKYVSFFRRLAEKKGSPKIEWETVWCMEKRKEDV